MFMLGPIFSDTEVPSVISTTKTNFTNYYYYVDVQLPSSKVPGDLLLFLLARKFDTREVVPGFSWPAGYTQLYSGEVQSKGGDNKGYLVSFAYHVVTPSDGSTVSVYTNEQYGSISGAVCIHVRNWHGVAPPEHTYNYNQFVGLGDPPNLAPSWGSAQTLWFAAMFELGPSFIPTPPSGYSGFDYLMNPYEEKAVFAWCYKMQEAASENPSPFGSVDEPCVAFTIAVCPQS